MKVAATARKLGWLLLPIAPIAAGAFWLALGPGFRAGAPLQQARDGRSCAGPWAWGLCSKSSERRERRNDGDV